ncbi:JAB domain-containing protein [Novosphingobium mangrovi (ex Huang et al. 2023)]|uniref:DNA repair protein RadC n=1 Tax=Novosphingobium mangrovi (ex Huang et al. 2023) TaxID=2976432 RepID=A0ABT2I3F9_9SPHN|nr:JAB domain-containing protein [Novosphingobium mangrovi (ex Huang et al. 2023)]MCT2399333.1 DNA repair protein RadC [Novosphingobium mangrovi (ex Huang et al. 2023)]
MAAEQAGQLSVLARLLYPYAGDRSEVVARRLIRHFGSIRTIWSASIEALDEALAQAEECPAEVGALIVAARQLAEAAAREALIGQPIDTRAPEFRYYLVRRLGMRREECLMILFFTGEGLFLAEDFYDGGQRAEVTIPLRQTVRRALDLDARRLVVAHNHPSGSAEPSEADIAATAQLRRVVEALEVGLDDHCIVAGNVIASMRSMGLI